MPSVINATTTSGVAISPDNSGSLQLATNNGTTAVTIDTSQNVGIGTTSPADKLNVVLNNSSLGGIRLQNTNGSGQSAVSYYNDGNTQKADIWWNNNGSILNFRTLSTDPMVFTTNNTERMRITSGGDLLVGSTGQVASERLRVVGSSTNVISVHENTNANPKGLYSYYSNAAPNGAGNEFLQCNDNAALRMSVRSNGGIANYSANDVNLSDEKEKTNIQLASSYLNKICAIPVKTFNYIDQNRETDDGLTLGVIAQDVQKVAPELVMESDWSLEKDGSKMRLSIYQTDLQYALMKCIQEQQAQIEQLKAEVQALKGAA